MTVKLIRTWDHEYDMDHTLEAVLPGGQRIQVAWFISDGDANPEGDNFRLNLAETLERHAKNIWRSVGTNDSGDEVEEAEIEVTEAELKDIERAPTTHSPVEW